MVVLPELLFAGQSVHASESKEVCVRSAQQSRQSSMLTLVSAAADSKLYLAFALGLPLNYPNSLKG